MQDTAQSDPRPRLAVEQRPLPAWSLSLGLHLAAIVLIAYLMRWAPRGSAATQPDRTVGVALVAEVAGEREYVSADPTQPTAEAAAAADLSEALPAESALAVDLSSMLPSLNEGVGAADSLAVPRGSGGSLASGLQGMANNARTSVFGTSGNGSRFVYVFDRSGSMAGFAGRPLAAAKRELIASLRDLDETNQFQIIFYNEDPHVFRFRSGAPSLVWASAEGLESAERFVQGITATGSTRHLDPLRTALGMRPDVIFFLTDADEPQLTADELRQIRRWNSVTAINAIEFGFGPPSRRDNFLVRLARENGGEHVYVDVSNLATFK